MSQSNAAPAAETSSTPAAEATSTATETPAAVTTETPAAETPAPASPLDKPLVSKPDEPKAEEPKAEEPKVEPAPEMKAEDYVLDPLPEGMGRDDPVLAKFLDGAARGGMDNESVRAIVSEMAPMIREQMDAPIKLWVETTNKWKNEIMADPEIGGERFSTHTLPTITAALDQFGAEGIWEAMHVTGAGNHPAIVRTLYKMAAQLTEAKTVPVTNTSPVAVNSRAAALYPSAKT